MENRAQSSFENNPEIKKIQLEALFELTLAINANYTTAQLLKITGFILRSQLNIGKAAFFYFDKNWQCLLKQGVPIDSFNSTFDIEKEIPFLNSEVTSGILNKTHDISRDLKDFDIFIPVRHKSNTLAVLLLGNLTFNNTSFREENLPFIHTLANILLLALENKRLARERVKQEGMKKELELAAHMQNMLFPSTLLKNEKIEMMATYLPHQDIGGDYYDYAVINEDEFIICIADVSGKGLAAAILASNFQASFHSLLKDTVNLKSMITRLNKQVNENAKGEKFITFFIAKIDLKKKELTYINAGHNPPLYLQNNKVTQLSEGCIGLGMFDELPFLNMGKINIIRDSLLFLYTDGIIEQENDKGAAFGVERLSEFVSKNSRNDQMGDFHKKIIDFVNAFKRDQPYNDDITLFSCRF